MCDAEGLTFVAELVSILFQAKMAEFQARVDVARAECLAQRKKERKKRRKAEEEAAKKEEAVREGEGECGLQVYGVL